MVGTITMGNLRQDSERRQKVLTLVVCWFSRFDNFTCPQLLVREPIRYKKLESGVRTATTESDAQRRCPGLPKYIRGLLKDCTRTQQPCRQAQKLLPWQFEIVPKPHDFRLSVFHYEAMTQSIRHLFDHIHPVRAILRGLKWVERVLNFLVATLYSR